MWVQLMKKKTACYRPFKNRHFVRVCTEKMMEHQCKVSRKDVRNTCSKYSQVKAYVDCSPDQSRKTYTLLTVPYSN